MDIKRLLTALLLSFIFIVTWNVFFPPATQTVSTTNAKQEKPFDKDLINETKQAVNPIKLTQQPNQVSTVYEDGGAPISINTPLIELDLINGGTSIHNLRIVEQGSDNTYRHKGNWNLNTQEYNKNSPVQLLNEALCNPCLLIDAEIKSFVVVEMVEEQDVNKYKKIISQSNDGLIKETYIYNNSYTIDHVFKNLPTNKNITVLWDQGLLPSEKMANDDMLYFSIYAQNNESYEEEYLSSVENGEIFEFNDNVGWAGIKSKYFMKAITNNDYQYKKAEQVIFQTYNDYIIEGTQIINSDMSFYYRGEDLINQELKVSSYMGPIDTRHLQVEESKHLVQLFGFGWFFIGYLGQGIMWLLTSLYAIIPNYGLVCVLFAFIIRFFTGPLTKKSFLSNQKMQAIQPKLKKIQTKYKNDSGKLNQEIMNLYKNEGVNPLGGCLPILVQMPLLIALFQVFRKTIEFRGASFLPFWITDLSQPDVIIYLPFLKEIWGINYFFGHGIALLPIIMGVVMFLNMKMTTTNNINPSQASTMYIMNGFFILLFNTFPSGLNLYYTVYNILNFLQQKKLQKISS